MNYVWYDLCDECLEDVQVTTNYIGAITHYSDAVYCNLCGDYCYGYNQTEVLENELGELV